MRFILSWEVERHVWMHDGGGAEFSSFWKCRSLFWDLTPQAKGLAMHPISPGCKATICCLFWQCRPRLLAQSEWGGQEVCASWPKASGLWELSGVLSCLFWESFCLVGWYLETAKNFALHFHSNRKEKGGCWKPWTAFQIPTSQTRTAWLQFALLPHSNL